MPVKLPALEPAAFETCAENLLPLDARLPLRGTSGQGGGLTRHSSLAG